MNMLTVHRQAASGPQSLYHEFLIRFRKGQACIWGFVEGKTDPSFYVGTAEHMLPDRFEVELWPAGNKQRVIDLYALFDWERFNQGQVLFFIDRDLSAFVPDCGSNAPNVYTTDNYSIENDLVTRQVCKRVLREIMGLEALRGAEMDTVLDLFDAQLSKFHCGVLRIMAHVVAWRRRGERPCSENLKMKDLFEIDSGILNTKKAPAGCRTQPAYLCKKLKLTRRGLMNPYRMAVRDLKRCKEPKHYVRGKYELWFLVSFCESVRQNAAVFCRTLHAAPKPETSLGVSNALCLVGPRARAPRSLRRFLKRTCCAYANGAVAV